jgi:hypothetical protein
VKEGPPCSQVNTLSNNRNKMLRKTSKNMFYSTHNRTNMPNIRKNLRKEKEREKEGERVG